MAGTVFTGEEKGIYYDIHNKPSSPVWKTSEDDWSPSESEDLWPDPVEADKCTMAKAIYSGPNSSNAENDADELEKKFRTLTDLWKQETLFTSSFTDIVMNMAYQRIIGMGPAVVPLILRELEKRLAHWFWALHAITGEDPTTPEQQGRLREMANAWLKWGKDKGCL